MPTGLSVIIKTICQHPGKSCDGVEFCTICQVQIFSGYKYGDERYCNDHKPAAWDAAVAEITEEFDNQDEMYWSEFEIEDIQCECVCSCRPSQEALQALYDADRTSKTKEDPHESATQI